MKIQNLFILGFFLLTEVHLHAAPAKSTTKLANKSSIAVSFSGDDLFTVQSSEYVSSRANFFRDGAASNISSIAISINKKARWRSLTGDLKLKDEYSAGERWNYLNLYEAYGSVPLSRNSVFNFGRKLDRWSEWESDWNQGVFQSRYMQNKLRPEEAGLVGLFLESKTQSMAMTVGLLPIFIPDLGAHFYTSNYRFESANPWFLPPASKFVLPNNQGDIRYSLNAPAPEKVLNNPGLVGKLEFQEGAGCMGRISAAYKPMPQMLLGFPSFNRMVITPIQDYMSVEVNARSLYHRVLSVDQICPLNEWRLSGSVTHEDPDSERGPEDWTAQQATQAWIWAFSASRPLEAEGPYAARLKLGYLRVVGGDAKDRGEFAGDEALFERRYQYLEAYQLGLSKPWRGLFQYPLVTELRVAYDLRQNGGVFSLSSSLNLTRQAQAFVQIDVMGLLGAGAEIDDGFFALYRANDRVGVGMNYVF